MRLWWQFCSSLEAEKKIEISIIREFLRLMKPNYQRRINAICGDSTRHACMHINYGISLIILRNFKGSTIVSLLAPPLPLPRYLPIHLHCSPSQKHTDRGSEEICKFSLYR